ncbi:type II toxin-antitoxin system HicB family antitoxin [Bacillus sp. 31A1R]|uniref:Type II toxin-antitoxin system HicB family antitoxin n=1 Tax=Robertmurraya mangrovi TaxID=3098077 RepID=A0ABU5IYR4_9BACI|nr:type II toxin-antitoxin system HicB family antitoxin [Bacillus sp. 31A1R]MDZ5472237.1 type II toxin-antitoxin system HicB family antitoxin [Bacillus sp. 31A1R]
MKSFGKLVYPAFVQQDDEGMFCVYFPTLFPESGWEFPLSKAKTKRKAIKNAEKDLAYSLAGILYDNEELPEPIPIQSDRLSPEMELINIETLFEPYGQEIQEHLKGRHWHIGYYDEDTEEYLEAIGFKNDQGMWDIFYEFYSEEEGDHIETFLFTVKLRSEAEERFKQYVEEKILKRGAN